ncbi:MAG: O-antigen/teichoic acid export membrane protein [Acidimicrobiales bacterium]|jgi:O-antigen/teichoic acid export membrane protein
MSILLVAQMIINGDVVLAKALFDAEAAGIYAVVALVGRGVFFLSWSIVMAAFPMAARDGGRQVVRQAAAVIGVFIFGTKETESPVCPSPQTAV